MVEKRQQTTVTIDTNTGARLERLAKANGVSKKERIYFPIVGLLREIRNKPSEARKPSTGNAETYQTHRPSCSISESAGT